MSVEIGAGRAYHPCMSDAGRNSTNATSMPGPRTRRPCCAPGRRRCGRMRSDLDISPRRSKIWAGPSGAPLEQPAAAGRRASPEAALPSRPDSPSGTGRRKIDGFRAARSIALLRASPRASRAGRGPVAGHRGADPRARRARRPRPAMAPGCPTRPSPISTSTARSWPRTGSPRRLPPDACPAPAMPTVALTLPSAPRRSFARPQTTEPRPACRPSRRPPAMRASSR